MTTTCYCIGCKKHPLHAERKDFKNLLTGYLPGRMIPAELKNQGVQVDCLLPDSSAFAELDVEPKDFTFKVTAYGDGGSITGVDGSGYEIYAVCGNEDHEN